MASLVRSVIGFTRKPNVLRLASAFYSNEGGVHDRIDQLVKSDKVVVFMKGTPDEPRCGFSNGVARILEIHGVSQYKAVDVLEDEDIRQGIKDYSKWPTVPQVYFNGEFVGGCDIMLDMHKSGELVTELEKVGVKSPLAEN